MTDRPSSRVDDDHRLRFACACASAVPIAEDPWVAIVSQRKLNDGTKELILNAIYRQPRTITQLAELFGISAPAVHRHVVEMLSDLWTSTFGRAATHLWVAASTDPALQSFVLPLERQLNQDTFAVTLELLGADPSKPQVRESVGLTLQLVRGIGLSALLRRDNARRKAELAQWATMLAAIEGVIGRLPL